MKLIRHITKWLFAGIFIVSGVLHFTRRDVYMRLIPPILPYHLEIVLISGVVEGALGVLLLVPRTQRFAAWALMATLVAIFPANIYAAITAGTDQSAMPGVSVGLAWLRLPLQPLLIAWAYAYTR